MSHKVEISERFKSHRLALKGQSSNLKQVEKTDEWKFNGQNVDIQMSTLMLNCTFLAFFERSLISTLWDRLYMPLIVINAYTPHKNFRLQSHVGWVLGDIIHWEFNWRKTYHLSPIQLQRLITENLKCNCPSHAHLHAHVYILFGGILFYMKYTACFLDSLWPLNFIAALKNLLTHVHL